MTAEPAIADVPYEKSNLYSRSFIGLLITQFFTAVNDNIFRWLVIGVAKDYVAPSQIGMVLMAGTLCFVAPYLLLAAPAGYFADRYSKKHVIVACKIAEIVVMFIGILAILSQNVYFVFGVVALMGAQSALFAPAKLGAIPETLKTSSISAANGAFGLATVVATVVGMGIGSWLSDLTRPKGLEQWYISAAVLLGVAIVGTLASLLVRTTPVANEERKFPWDAPIQSIRDLGLLFSHRALFRVALGMVFFWAIGALAQLNIDQLAAEGGAMTETAKNPMLISLIAGVCAGSVLAGVWSSGRVELGILPLGALGVVVSGLLLFTVGDVIILPQELVTSGMIWACILLFGLGTSAGLFSVPLESYMQHRSPEKVRGSILSATNLVVFSGVMLSAVLYYGLRYPAYEGSLSAVPAALRSNPDDAGEAKIKQLEADFREEWKTPYAGEEDKRPPAESVVKGLKPPVRKEALARLLWIELSARREQGAVVPLYEYLERFDPGDKRLAKAVYDQAGGLPLFDSQSIFLLVGVIAIPVFIYIVSLIPQASMRFIAWLASKTVYRIRVTGLENLPETGGAMLVPNHVSWLDGILLLLTCSRHIRMVVFAGNFKEGWLTRMAHRWGAIMISNRPKEIVKALQTARDALEEGELVGIFPEGGITRTGQIQAFRPGMMKILKGVSAPVIPVYLDGLWGSIFSADRGKFFWKKPKKWPYPVSIHFGKPMDKPADVHEVRRAVQDLGAIAVESRTSSMRRPPASFIRMCKKRGSGKKVFDSTGAKLNGHEVLVRSLVLRRLLRRLTLAKDEKYVGMLLPPSAGGLIANAALALDRRVGVNLNYTVSCEVMNDCIKQAGIKHVLTSKRFFDKIGGEEKFKLDAEIVFLEDFKDKPTGADKAIAGMQTYALPAAIVERSLGLHKIKPDDELTVIFTSGSTGTPKGVVLTHANVASNVEAVDTVVQLNNKDVLMGVLPFFHSFGYTVSMWGVMSLDISGVYHFNPLDSKNVAKLVERHEATLLLATPTFLRMYLRSCPAERFKTLDVVVAGAERLPPELCDAFEEKFGVRPVEGYGATELSPLVSVNVPPSRRGDNFQTDCKEGTVGRCIPGVTAKILNLDTNEEQPNGEAGMLYIKGPNVMRGYLGRDDLTSEVVADGWYKTGDVALIDDEGFIKITGRVSRFSKIGGEMIPHIKVEEAINDAIGLNEEGGIRAVVTAVPHATKGERLIVVHTPFEMDTDEVRQKLTEAGLPNIYIPAANSFTEVEELPMLGSGKLDLKGIKKIAEERFAAE